MTDKLLELAKQCRKLVLFYNIIKPFLRFPRKALFFVSVYFVRIPSHHHRHILIPRIVILLILVWNVLFKLLELKSAAWEPEISTTPLHFLGKFAANPSSSRPEFFFAGKVRAIFPVNFGTCTRREGEENNTLWSCFFFQLGWPLVARGIASYT